MAEGPTNVHSAEGRALAVRLREAREFLNLSQKFVSDQTGLPRTAISDIERAARRVESLELKRLAALYRMPVSYFLGEVDDPELAGAEDTAAQALARATSGLSNEDKAQVVRFALFLQNFNRSPEN